MSIKYIIKIIKRNQTEILKLENTITKKKNSWEGCNIRFEQTEEKISELEDKTIETILRSRKKIMKENKQSLRDLWNIIHITTFALQKSQKREKGRKNIEEMMMKTSQI